MQIFSNYIVNGIQDLRWFNGGDDKKILIDRAQNKIANIICILEIQIFLESDEDAYILMGEYENIFLQCVSQGVQFNRVVV